MKPRRTAKEPVRTCVACKKAFDKARLLRFVLEADVLRPDPDKKLAGRGAYICKESACVEKVIETPALFARAFKRAVKIIKPEEISALIK